MYQRVVEADVDVQLRVAVAKLHDRHLRRRHREDVADGAMMTQHLAQLLDDGHVVEALYGGERSECGQVLRQRYIAKALFRGE